MKKHRVHFPKNVPDRNLWGLEFRTGSYGPKILKLQAEATIKMMKMSEDDLEKIFPSIDQDYHEIKDDLYKAWKNLQALELQK